MKVKRKATNITREGEKKETQSDWGEEMCTYVYTNKENRRKVKKIRTASKGE
jgi:hypothetical protein